MLSRRTMRKVNAVEGKVCMCSVLTCLSCEMMVSSIMNRDRRGVELCAVGADIVLSSISEVRSSNVCDRTYCQYRVAFGVLVW